MNLKKSILAGMTFVFLLAGCMNKDEVTEFNKPALYWYKQIGTSISNGKSFLGVKDVYKDQKLIMDSISNANKYLLRYPGSAYAPLVNTILIRLHMSQYLLNENIAALYDRTGKPEGAKIYREKNSGSVVGMTDITPPEQGIIGMVFD